MLVIDASCDVRHFFLAGIDWIFEAVSPESASFVILKLPLLGDVVLEGLTGWGQPPMSPNPEVCEQMIKLENALNRSTRIVWHR